MATTDLSAYNPQEVPSGVGKKVAIVVSEWNSEVTRGLLSGAIETLKKHGVKEEDITVKWVPGSFELIYRTKQIVVDHPETDGIITLGSIVRGETPHFDYISESTTVNLGKLNADLETKIPIIMGVLTTDDMQQALDRAGGVHGNKGVEAAVTLLKMMD